jgi:predicted transcriptional regulator
VGKSLTLRLSDEQARELEAVSQVEDTPVSQLIRAAIAADIERRRADAAFQSRLKASLARNRKLLEMLADC